MLVYALFRACPADASAKLGLPPSGLPASPSTRPAQLRQLSRVQCCIAHISICTGKLVADDCCTAGQVLLHSMACLAVFGRR